MSMSKQTAVDWLVVELNQELNYTPITQWDRVRDLVQRAKEMEKQQIIDAANTLLYSGTGPGNMWAEQYYEQTFGGNNEHE